jgi:hypothetical protein
MGKLKGKAEIIIIAIITIIIIGVVIYFNIANKKEPIIYGVAEASGTVSNTFIEDSKSLKKFISKSSLNDEITIDYKKYSVKERYNEEFFKAKKLAIVAVSEDTSKEYIHDITDLIYNEERTDATVKYIYKTDGYKGKFSRSWVTCMIVEVDNTVTNVNFVLDNSSIEEDKK